MTPLQRTPVQALRAKIWVGVRQKVKGAESASVIDVVADQMRMNSEGFMDRFEILMLLVTGVGFFS